MAFVPTSPKTCRQPRDARRAVPAAESSRGRRLVRWQQARGWNTAVVRCGRCTAFPMIDLLAGQGFLRGQVPVCIPDQPQAPT